MDALLLLIRKSRFHSRPSAWQFVDQCFHFCVLCAACFVFGDEAQHVTQFGRGGWGDGGWENDLCLRSSGDSKSSEGQGLQSI